SFFALIISFILIFVSWLGHHNLLKALDRASSPFLIANGFFLFTVIIIPFPTAFVAEYLNTPYAQPAIVFYSVIGLLHNLGWNVLYHYMLKPKSLVKPSIGADVIRNYQQSARYAFLVYLAMAILSWWFPYVAITFNLLIWIYWLYLSATVNQDLGAET
ncbi:MAG TPA: TMEM175 family protein, partial [Saprospiraceae bacterium]|nr:TMEM175 family protein [Saprospiraceae bacterium]